MADPAVRFADRMKAVSDPSRLRIVSLLRQGDLPLVDIQHLLGTLTHATVAHHLRKLVDAGFISVGPRVGHYRFYRLEPKAFEVLADDLRKLGNGR
jgi:ArsR family transcriptional regulator